MLWARLVLVREPRQIGVWQSSRMRGPGLSMRELMMLLLLLRILSIGRKVRRSSWMTGRREVELVRFSRGAWEWLRLLEEARIILVL